MTLPSVDHRRARGQATKKKLLLAALQLVGRSGLEGFSAQALAKEAGVSQSLLYHHFTNMEGLIPGLAKLIFEYFEQALGGAKPRTLKAYLERVGRLSLDPAFYSGPVARAGAELYRRSLTNALLRGLMKRMRDAGHERLAADLAAYARTPAEKARAREAVDLLLPLADGLQLHLALFGDRAGAARAWAMASAQAEAHIFQGPPSRRNR